MPPFRKSYQYDLVKFLCFLALLQQIGLENRVKTLNFDILSWEQAKTTERAQASDVKRETFKYRLHYSVAVTLYQ
jgi:hypothetical protein